jgi:predicted nucleic acid-binding protein
VTPVRFLLDTSALVRLLRNPTVQAGWEQQISAGLVAVCPIVELELLYSARSAAHRDEMVDLLASAFAWVPMPERVFTHAADLQAALTMRALHRCASAVDLLVAATAGLHALTLVHYDRDFDQITKITGQPAAWLAPAGSMS